MGDIELNLLQEQLRLRVQTKCGYKPVLSQIRWLRNYFATYVNGAEVIDSESFINALINLHFVGVRSLLQQFFNRFAKTEGEDAGLIVINEFATELVKNDLQKKRDTMRRKDTNMLEF